MIKNLVIVESPAKAKTIEKFLGADFKVTSSYGHIRDLAGNSISVDVENNFEPQYEISADKKKLVAELKKLAKDSEIIWLATDEDREGEAISWHLLETLNLDIDKTRRIVFHEITKNAILHAIANPRKLNKNLVDAQQARRVLDRLVGYELSPVLWKKVKPSLSAGRVQSVSVKLIVEREREIIDFKPSSSFKPRATFLLKDKKTHLKAELNTKFSTKDKALSFLELCKDSEFGISDISVKPSKKSPAAPFTTSTLQQEASRKLGFSVSKTMTMAQKLYEAGFITYMRTDSVNLSDSAIDAAKKEITKSYGEKYSQVRKFSTKSQGAQEAHEAIRPSYMENHTVKSGKDEMRLYELIWKRTIASQMADAQLENTNIKVSISKSDNEFIAHGQVVKFDGFLKVYLESNDDEDESNDGDVILPPLKVGEEVNLEEIESRERFTRPSARYTEAALVRKLEELGIGRPSTYAPTISTIIKRDYVKKESRPGEERSYISLRLKNNKISETQETENFGAEKNKLFPSDIGIVVTDFLSEHFKNVMDYSFTARVEQEFDDIAQGMQEWQKMLENFYGPFHAQVSETEKTAERANQQRFLGTHPTENEPIYARYGKYGPFVQLGESDDETKKPVYAKMRSNQLIETITLEDALELFKLPRNLGEFEEKPVTADIGRFGPYVKHNNKFVSIPKDQDPYEIQLDTAIELILKKREIDANKFINSFEHDGKTIEILNGRWGPYIKVGKENFKIPKETVAADLSLEQTLEIINNAPPKKKAKKK